MSHWDIGNNLRDVIIVALLVIGTVLIVVVH